MLDKLFSKDGNSVWGDFQKTEISSKEGGVSQEASSVVPGGDKVVTTKECENSQVGKEGG